MRHKTFLSIALALALASAGSAFAQGNSRHDRGNNDCPNGNCAGPDQRHRPSPNARQPSRPSAEQRQYQERNAPPRYAQPHFVQPRYDSQQRRYDGIERDQRGAGPDHSYYRGGRLPPQYRTQHYVVQDWRGHHLKAPPRGYHWVQSGGDYLLVAITTGVILQLLLSN